MTISLICYIIATQGDTMATMKYKECGKQGLFDKEDAINLLSEMGNSLERLSRVIDFEMFRPLLEDHLKPKEQKYRGGARPYDYVLMLKVLVLQSLFGLSDKQVQYQITDRLSFKVFLGLSSGDKVPDEKSVWAFREKLTKLELIETIFEQFHQYLIEKGLVVNEGKMIDASFAPAPKQRNTREENQKIKDGQGAELWNDNPAKKRHKDIDARWTKKNNVSVFGFKNHAKVDKASKIVDSYHVTDASVHDSQALEPLLDDNDKGQELYADSAYTGESQDATIQKKEMINKVHEKGYKNRALTEEQKNQNHEKSKIRSRVEHVFGYMEQTMKGLKVRSIGIARAKGIIGLINLTYNLMRYEQIMRLGMS